MDGYCLVGIASLRMDKIFAATRMRACVPTEDMFCAWSIYRLFFNADMKFQPNYVQC